MTTSSPTIGLALGAGGARGFCHIGALLALDEMGVRADLIAGTSMGALVGAIYAGGAICAFHDWALDLTRQRILTLADPQFGRGGLVGARAIHDLLKRFDVPDDFGALTRRFAAVATDLRTGREARLQKGLVSDAVRASVALPGVVTPHRIGRQWYIDGGLTNPVPVSACRKMGADIVIAIDPSAKAAGIVWNAEETRDLWGQIGQFGAAIPGLPAAWSEFLTDSAQDDSRIRPPRYADVIVASVDIMSSKIVRKELEDYPPDILLNADLGDLSILEFDRAADGIAEGRRIIEANADKIRALALPPDPPLIA